MSNHLTSEDIARYRGRQLAASDVARVQDHADECADCRGRLAATGAAASLRAMLDPEPDEQELVRFVAGQLPAERTEEIAGHVKGCAKCTDAVDDLRRFARQAPPQPIRRVNPMRWGAIAAAAVLAAGLGWWALRRASAPPESASLQDAAGKVVLTASREVRGVAGVNSQEREWLAAELASASLPAPSHLWITPAASVLRGAEEPGGFRMLGPVNVRTVSDKPTFTWEALAGAHRYEVTIVTEDEYVVTQSGPIEATEWRPTVPLPRQQILAWQVTAVRGAERVTEPAPPKPRAQFEAISAEAAARIEALRAQKTPSHLLLAAWYAHEGLSEEAAKELSLLAARNSESPLVKQLQQSLAAR